MLFLTRPLIDKYKRPHLCLAAGTPPTAILHTHLRPWYCRLLRIGDQSRLLCEQEWNLLNKLPILEAMEAKNFDFRLQLSLYKFVLMSLFEMYHALERVPHSTKHTNINFVPDAKTFCHLARNFDSWFSFFIDRALCQQIWDVNLDTSLCCCCC